VSEHQGDCEEGGAHTPVGTRRTLSGWVTFDKLYAEPQENAVIGSAESFACGLTHTDKRKGGFHETQ
jgi:hypothetical protein